MTLFEKIEDDAIIPTKAYARDAGWDLYSREDVVVAGMMGHYFRLYDQMLELAPEDWDALEHRMKKGRECTYRFDTGIRINLPPSRVGLIWDKSGIGDRLIKVFGGVIDESYQGPIKIRMLNYGMDEWVVEKGMKIAQLLIQPIDYIQDHDFRPLIDAERGVSGFGSTDQTFTKEKGY